MTWICASCGANHDENDPPCRQCAGEQFAKLDETRSPVQRIDGVQHTQWECKSCGENHPKNNPPCKRCGGMDFQAVHTGEPAPAADGGVASFNRTSNEDSFAEPDGRRKITLWSIGYYLLLIWMALTAIGGLISGIVPAVLAISAFLLTLRTSRSKLFDTLSLDVSNGVLYVSIAVCYFGANIWITLA